MNTFQKHNIRQLLLRVTFFSEMHSSKVCFLSKNFCFVDRVLRVQDLKSASQRFSTISFTNSIEEGHIKLKHSNELVACNAIF